MVNKRSFAEKLFDCFNIVFMVMISFLFVYPLWFCLVSSFSDPFLLSRHQGPLFWTLGYSTAAYKLVVENSMILRGLLNTVFYVIAGTTLSILMTSFGAYVLSRKNYFWKKPLTFMIIFTMYFGGGLIPTYILVMNTLHMGNSPFAMIIPYVVNTFYLIIMRTYFAGIPDSMEESAVMDGANDFMILLFIYLPLAMPVIAVLIIYYGVGQWNSWFSASIFLTTDRQWQPLQLILREILTQGSAQSYTRQAAKSLLEQEQVGKLIKYALIIITVTPIIAIYPFMQKHFIKGVMIGSLKE